MYFFGRRGLRTLPLVRDMKARPRRAKPPASRAANGRFGEPRASTREVFESHAWPTQVGHSLPPGNKKPPHGRFICFLAEAVGVEQGHGSRMNTGFLASLSQPWMHSWMQKKLLFSRRLALPISAKSTRRILSKFESSGVAMSFLSLKSLL